jgi:outer membrane protein
MNKNQSKSVPVIIWAIIILSLLLSVLSLTYSLSRKDNKLAYVDALKLIGGYKGTEAVRNNLNSVKEGYKVNLNTLRSEVEQMILNYDKVKQKSSPREKKLTEGLIQSKQKQLLDYEQLVKEQSQKQDQELSSQILNTVNAYIKQYGEREGFTIILSATHYGSIAYGDQASDITDKILAGLNAEYKSTKNFK